jgi:hypothetical protein
MKRLKQVFTYLFSQQFSTPVAGARDLLSQLIPEVLPAPEGASRPVSIRCPFIPHCGEKRVTWMCFCHRVGRGGRPA